MGDVQGAGDGPGLAGEFEFADGFAGAQPEKLVIEFDWFFHGADEGGAEEGGMLGEVAFLVGIDELHGLGDFVHDASVAAALFADFPNQSIARRFVGFDTAAGEEIAAGDADDGDLILCVEDDSVGAGAEFIILICQTGAEDGNVDCQGGCPIERRIIWTTLIGARRRGG
jgi:hypothetical protein